MREAKLDMKLIPTHAGFEFILHSPDGRWDLSHRASTMALAVLPVAGQAKYMRWYDNQSKADLEAAARRQADVRTPMGLAQEQDDG